MSNRAVVVGAGLGGLATAIRLANQGWQVTVLEQGTSPGGKLNRLERNGYTFDTGPSLITLPHVFDRLFQVGGADFYRDLQPVRLDPMFEYRFGPEETLTYSSQLPVLMRQIEEITGSRSEVEALYRFLELGAELYALSEKTFFARPPFGMPRISDLPLLMKAPKRHAWGKYRNAVRHHFKSRQMRQIFERYPTYVGASPESAVGTLALIPYMEFAFGGWYIPGGLYRIVEALTRMAADAGVRIELGCAVMGFNAENGRIASVVDSSGRSFSSDVVVANADPATVHQLTDGAFGKHVTREQLSMSGLVLLIGLAGRAEGLKHHTVCFSDDYDREFSQIFNEQRFPEDPTVYVNIPSITDRSMAPENGDAVFVMANTPADPLAWTPEFEATAIQRVRNRILASGMPDLIGRARFIESWTPARLESECSAPGGAIYGQVSHGWRGTFFRPPLKEKRSRNLYYVGGGTHPGGGTPTVLMSAEIVTRMIGQAAP